MSKTFQNWIAVVAILAVALLGVVAIDRNADSRIETQRESLVNLCLRQNEARVLANGTIQQFDNARKALTGALEIAAQERGQRDSDRVAYARFQALLESAPQEPQLLPAIDCEKEIPKP